MRQQLRWIAPAGAAVLVLAAWWAWRSPPETPAGTVTAAASGEAEASTGMTAHAASPGSSPAGVARIAAPAIAPLKAPAISVAESYPSQRFAAAAYEQGRMEIFGGFWRTAEQEWDVPRYRFAEAEQGSLDGRQAYQVYVYLRTCLDAPRDPQDAADYLARVEQAADHNRRLQDPEQLERILERVDGALLRCEGLQGDLEDDAMAWLVRAAERGYPLAQIAYYRSYRWLASRKPYLIFGDAGSIYAYRQLAPKFLEAALGSGHAEAFAEMALALEEGVVFDRDTQAAYAYARAARLAAGAVLDVGNRQVEELAEELSPAERRAAERTARELCDTYCL